MYQLKNNRTEWKIRYEIALDIAKQEYLLQIERIKNLDEKIEKFLIVAAAFIAALVAILGNLNTMLSIHQKSESWVHFMNGAITLLITYALFLSFDTFRNFLKGLKLTETRRMPNTIELINDPKEASLEWTYGVIEFYEEARKFLNQAAHDKITYLSKGQGSLEKQAIVIFLVIATTFVKSIFLKG